MSDRRKVRNKESELGEFSLDQLYRMASRKEIDHNSEFWSERKNEWLPLSEIMFDIQPSRVPEIKEAGISKVEILGVGDDDCAVCKSLQQKEYGIDEVPDLPPEGCTCTPWCRLTPIARG